MSYWKRWTFLPILVLPKGRISLQHPAFTIAALFFDSAALLEGRVLPIWRHLAPLFRPLPHLACVHWNSSWWFLNPNEAVGERKAIFQKWKFQTKTGLKSIIEVFMKHPSPSFFWSPVHHDFQHKNLCCKRQQRHLRTSAVEEEALRLSQKKLQATNAQKTNPLSSVKNKGIFGGGWSYEMPPFWLGSFWSVIDSHFQKDPIERAWCPPKKRKI